MVFLLVARHGFILTGVSPQHALTIFGKEAEKLMIYFTMPHRTDTAKLYYAYVNNDFDRLESTPQILFEYPDEKITALDADIIKVDDKYRVFYVLHDGVTGIKQAGSDRANRGNPFDPRWYDPDPKDWEGPNVWKRLGEEKWGL